jgi:hypothetical protein
MPRKVTVGIDRLYSAQYRGSEEHHQKQGVRGGGQ